MTRTESKSYAQLRGQLDAVLARMQSGDLDIDEAIAAHTEGTELIKQLQQYLKAAENTVAKISANLEKSAED